MKTKKKKNKIVCLHSHIDGWLKISVSRFEWIHSFQSLLGLNRCKIHEKKNCFMDSPIYNFNVFVCVCILCVVVCARSIYFDIFFCIYTKISILRTFLLCNIILLCINYLSSSSLPPPNSSSFIKSVIIISSKEKKIKEFLYSLSHSFSCPLFFVVVLCILFVVVYAKQNKTKIHHYTSGRILVSVFFVFYFLASVNSKIQFQKKW